MKNFIPALLLFGLVGCAGGSAEDSTTDFPKMAQELCACLQPMYDLSLEVRSIPPDANPDKQAALMDRFEATAQQSEACSEGLQEKYGFREGAAADSLERAFRIQCPEIAELLDQFGQEPAQE